MVDRAVEAVVRYGCRTCTWAMLPLLESLASVYGNEVCDLEPTVLQQLLDYLYFRSKILQSSFNFHMNYLQHTRGVDVDGSYVGGFAQAVSIQDGDVTLRCVGPTSLSRSERGVAVLFHGLLTSSDIFTTLEMSVVKYLRRNGYDTWVVDRARSGRPGPYPASTLLEIAEHVLSHSEGAVSVTWLAHSTACGDLLPAFRPVACSEGSVDHDRLIHLRNLTAHIHLLSPVVYPPSNSAHDAMLGRLRWNTEAQLPSLYSLVQGNLRLGEDMLRCEGRRLLQALPLWRDLLAPAAYVAYVVSPIARLALGWGFYNISPQRRRELLPTLFPQALSTGATHLVDSYRLCSENSEGLGNRITVQSVVRWCCRRMLGVVWSAVEWVCPRAHGLGRHKTRLELAPISISEDGPASQRLPPCRVTAVVGTCDALMDPSSLEPALAQLETEVHIVSGYEHMDTLWADDVEDEVFSIILERGTYK